MATIAKPLARVFQEFSITPSEITDPLRAHISGPNGKLHRYDTAAEKANIYVGLYDRLAETCYSWPGRTAGSVVDQDYVKVYMDDCRLPYFADLIGDVSSGRGVNTAVSGYTNRVRSTTVSFKANGTSYPRSALLADRDAKIGDLVYIRGVDDPGGDCDEYELWTYIAGFASDPVGSEIQSCSPATTNQATTIAAGEAEKTAGLTNDVDITDVDYADYDGLDDGDVEETYTVEVIHPSISGCSTAKIRVTSASGNDDVAEADVEDFGDQTDIGTRGLKVTFTGTDEMAVGEKWQITVSQDYEKVCCESGGDYSGPADDIYIIEVTKGGLFADLPEITVTTVKGLDYSGPTTVTGHNVEIPIGANGVTFKVMDCYGSATAPSSEPFGGDFALTKGLRKGDKFYVTVLSADTGAIKTLILRDDIPAAIRDATDLDLKLYLEKDGIEITENRLSQPPLVNYEMETTQICLQAGVTVYDSEWTSNGVQQPLTVEYGKIYVEYREWLATLASSLTFIDDVADIDDIPGQLDPDNPLKWGVYKALANTTSSSSLSQSEGFKVGYTAVTDPDDLDAWQDVLEVIDGKDSIYNLVPLTFDTQVLNLFETHIGNESTPEAGNWKAGFFPLLAKSTKMVVGESSAANQLLNPTSTDGEVVLATVSDNPNATGTQYTRLTVPEGNGGFITYGVAAGDKVRYLYTVDAWGTASYQEFTVDSVLSEDSLLLLTGPSAPVSVAQKIEIWHTLTKSEIIADLGEQAQAFSNRRVCAVWPDYVGAAGVTQEGYFLCAALAGLASSVVPQQPLTNVEVSGFDDFSRSTTFFSDSQLDTLDDSGVWIVTEDKDGTPHTRHALTTDTTDLNRQEEMIRRNVDSISMLMLSRLAPYIGRSNVTPTMLSKLRSLIDKALKYLRQNGFVPELGGQLADGINDEVSEITQLYVHPLLADRVVAVVSLVVPAPLNTIECHLVI